MKAFSDFFLDKPRLVTMILIFLTLLGISAIIFLPKEATPDITIPISFVQVIYPGVSPQDIEQEITNKVEDALESLNDVDYIESYIGEGYSTTIVYFLAGSDIDEKVRETRDEIATIRGELPADIDEPSVLDWSFSDQPVMVISLTSLLAHDEFNNLVDNVETTIEKVEGVSKVDVIGAQDEEVHVNIDPSKLILYNMTLDDIVQTIKRENFNIPVGTSEIGTNKFVLRSMGKFETLDDLGNVVLNAQSGRVVTLSDLAEIELSTEEKNSYARLNGEDCMNLIVVKKSGENLLKTVAGVKQAMETIAGDFPEGTEYRFIGDSSWHVRESNTNLMQNLIWGLILVFLILLFFLGWRSAAIITPTIPWSLFCGYLFIWACGYSISNVITFGGIIVLGMLVDDAIIVTENAMRHLEMGKDHFSAARDSIHEVGGAILAAGLTTFSAFGPMLFMPGITGQFIKFIPIIVISSLAGAILIAHGFTPVFCRYFLKLESHQTRTGRIFGGWIDFLIPYYQRFLKLTLAHPFITATMAWIIFFIAIIIVQSGLLGFELFPDAPFYKFNLDINTPIGTNIEETNRIVREVEKNIATVEEVEFFATAIGKGAGASNINLWGSSGSDNYGTIFGDLKDIKGGRTPEEIIGEMREKLKGISGAELEFVEINMGPPESAAVEMRLKGKDFKELERISEDAQDILAQIDGLVDIRDNYDPGFPEAQIIIDRERAALNGLSNTMIGATLRAAFEGTKAGEFYKDGEELDIIVQFPKEKRSSLEDLRQINIRNLKGQLIPFSQVAYIHYTSGVANIRHRDGDRTITIRADLDPLKDMSAFKAQTIYLPALQDYPLPPGYEFIFGGENEELVEDFISLFRAMMVGLMLMYIILCITFNSYYEPFNVLGAIPFACIGVVVGLIVTGNKFGFMPGVGIVSLSGIVVNDAIVLIDYINQQRVKHGMALDDAIFKGGCDRFRPVLMTSITTIVGILPLALGVGGGSEFWGPLGWSIIFGLLFSTVLILLIIPSFYKLSEWLFSPRFFWKNEDILTRIVRIAAWTVFAIGILISIIGATYFVLFME